MEHLTLLMTSIDYLTDDGQYDKDELLALVQQALSDGILTDDEKRVLRHVFEVARTHGIDTETESLIAHTSSKYQL